MRPNFVMVCLMTIGLFFSVKKQDIYGQSFEKLKQIRLKVLAENIIGKDYQYNLTERKDCNYTRIKYLGTVTTERNKKYKLLNSFFVFGPSCRGTSRIVIYDTKNKYIGNYYVGMPYNLPDTLIDNNLIYLNNNADCKFRKGTTISFEKGLPKSIFIPCDKSDSVDSYTFSNEE